MHFTIESLAARVSFVSGPEKNCGKTTFTVGALEAWRRRYPQQPPCLLTVGYDGETRDLLSGVRKPAVPVFQGDIFVTAERFLRVSGSCPEILDIVPGTTALGRCCIARATRPGQIALVGPENNSAVRAAIGQLRQLVPDSPVLVDGAINRITQVASVPDSSLIYVLRADRSNLTRSVDRLRRLGLLLRLEPCPAEITSCVGAEHETVLCLDGALTSETMQTIPPKAETLVVDDFTKIFLGTSELRALQRNRRLYVRTPVACSAVIAVLRGVSFEAFSDQIEDPWLKQLVCDNPYLALEAETATAI